MRQHIGRIAKTLIRMMVTTTAHGLLHFQSPANTAPAAERTHRDFTVQSLSAEERTVISLTTSNLKKQNFARGPYCNESASRLSLPATNQLRQM